LGTTGGGDFLLTVKEGPVGIYAEGAKFRSFCTEVNEYVSNDRNYYVTIDEKAWDGGKTGGPGDPLSAESAYLYTLWLDGSVGEKVFTYDTANTNALQNAIWYSEGEKSLSAIGGASSDAKKLYDYAVDAVTQGGDTDSWYNRHENTIGDIRVLNLWKYSNHTGYAQDQLVRIVPVPAAFVLGMLGMGVAGIRLRKSARRDG
jgi:hypothetical protein